MLSWYNVHCSFDCQCRILRNEYWHFVLWCYIIIPGDGRMHFQQLLIPFWSFVHILLNFRTGVCICSTWKDAQLRCYNTWTVHVRPTGRFRFPSSSSQAPLQPRKMTIDFQRLLLQISIGLQCLLHCCFQQNSYLIWQGQGCSAFFHCTAFNFGHSKILIFEFYWNLSVHRLELGHFWAEIRACVLWFRTIFTLK